MITLETLDPQFPRSSDPARTVHVTLAWYQVVAYVGPVHQDACLSIPQYCEHRYFHVYKFSRIYEMGNFACIKIHVLSINGSLGFDKSNFRGVHIFTDI